MTTEEQLAAALADNKRLREALEASDRWRRHYRKGKLEMYAKGGEYADFAMKHFPCNEGWLERNVPKLLALSSPPHPDPLKARLDEARAEAFEEAAKMLHSRFYAEPRIQEVYNILKDRAAALRPPPVKEAKP